MHREFCGKLGNPFCKDDDVAVKARTFWEDDKEEDKDFEIFAKPIRTPRDEAFWGGKGYNTHPLQELDK